MDLLGLLILVLIVYFMIRLFNEAPGPGRATPQNVVWFLMIALLVIFILSFLGHGPMVFWRGR